MLTSETIQKLRSFHLPGFVQAFMEQSESSAYRNLEFEERLTLLVEAEYSRRVAQRIERRLKAAELLTQATIDQVDFSVSRGLSKSIFLDLAQGNWTSNAHHLVITGPTGSGKTFIASALATNLCRKGLAVKYMRAHEWLADILINRSNGTLQRFRSQVARLNLIIIDEWLREPLPQSHARELLDLFDDRFRKASCIIISQLPVPDWHSQIADPTIADAILDRIVHDSIRIDLAGESMRKLTSPLSGAGGSSVASLR